MRPTASSWSTLICPGGRLAGRGRGRALPIGLADKSHLPAGKPAGVATCEIKVDTALEAKFHAQVERLHKDIRFLQGKGGTLRPTGYGRREQVRVEVGVYLVAGA